MERSSDPRALLAALRDLLASAQGLVQHLLTLHGGPESIVPPPPLARPALPPSAGSGLQKPVIESRKRGRASPRRRPRRR